MVTVGIMGNFCAIRAICLFFAHTFSQHTFDRTAPEFAYPGEILLYVVGHSAHHPVNHYPEAFGAHSSDKERAVVRVDFILPEELVEIG